MPRTKSILAGFEPVVIKAKKVVNTNTITISPANEKGAVTINFGEEFRKHFGNSVDVLANPKMQQLAIVNHTGADSISTAAIKTNASGKTHSIRVAGLTAKLSPEHFTSKLTLEPVWQDDHAFFALGAGEQINVEEDEEAPQA